MAKLSWDHPLPPDHREREAGCYKTWWCNTLNHQIFDKIRGKTNFNLLICRISWETIGRILPTHMHWCRLRLVSVIPTCFRLVMSICHWRENLTEASTTVIGKSTIGACYVIPWCHHRHHPATNFTHFLLNWQFVKINKRNPAQQLLTSSLVWVLIERRGRRDGIIAGQSNVWAPQVEPLCQVRFLSQTFIESPQS